MATMRPKYLLRSRWTEEDWVLGLRYVATQKEVQVGGPRKFYQMAHGILEFFGGKGFHVKTQPIGKRGGRVWWGRVGVTLPQWRAALVEVKKLYSAEKTRSFNRLLR